MPQQKCFIQGSTDVSSNQLHLDTATATPWCLLNTWPYIKAELQLQQQLYHCQQLKEPKDKLTPATIRITNIGSELQLQLQLQLQKVI